MFSTGRSGVNQKWKCRIPNETSLERKYVQCKHYNNNHGDRKISESNPEYKKWTSKHIKHVGRDVTNM